MFRLALIAILFCAAARAEGLPAFTIAATPARVPEILPVPAATPAKAEGWRKVSVGACVGAGLPGCVLFGVEVTAAVDRRISLVTRFDALFDFFFIGSIAMVGARFDNDKSPTKSLHFECGAILAAGNYLTADNPDDFAFGGGNYIGFGWEVGSRTVRFALDVYLIFHTDLNGFDIAIPAHIGFRVFF